MCEYQANTNNCCGVLYEYEAAATQRVVFGTRVSAYARDARNYMFLPLHSRKDSKYGVKATIGWFYR